MNLRPHFLSREQGLLSKFFPSQTREESKSPQDCAQSLPRHSSQHKRCNLFASPAFRHLNRPAAITAWQGPVLLLLILLPINEHGSSVQFSRSVVSDSLWPHGLQNTRPHCPSTTPRVYPNPCSWSQWCHSTSLFSVIPFSSRLQSFPAAGSFQMSQLFTSGAQNIGVSASTSVLPMKTQNWSPLGWTGWISLQSKGLSRVFSNTTVQKHEFCFQLSL